jgi:threonine dehydrogenase-like Zn-dependent dehydrogenase
MLPETVDRPLVYDAVSLASGKPVWMQETWGGVAPNFTARVRLAGLCRSDLKEAFGRRDVRSDFGHEMVLEIQSAPVGTSLAPGQRVIFDPHVRLRRSTGFAPVLYAQGDPETLKSAFVSIPEGMLDCVAVFTEPLACAVHAAEQALAHFRTASNGQAPRNVAFTAAGLSSVLQAIVLRQSGVECDLYNRTPARLAYLRGNTPLNRCGINFPLETPKDSYDIVVVSDALSDEASIQRALRLVRPRGLILLFGGTKTGESSLLLSLPKDALRRSEGFALVTVKDKPIAIGGTHGALRCDFDHAQTLLGTPASQLLFASLVDRSVSVQDLPELLHQLQLGRAVNFLKTLVETTPGDGSRSAVSDLRGKNKDML